MARVRVMPPTCREIARAFMGMCAPTLSPSPPNPPPSPQPLPSTLTLTRCGTRCHEALRELATGARGAHLALLLQAEEM